MVLKFLICSVDEKTKYKDIAGLYKTILILKFISKAPSEFLPGVLAPSLVDFFVVYLLLGARTHSIEQFIE